MADNILILSCVAMLFVAGLIARKSITLFFAGNHPKYDLALNRHCAPPTSVYPHHPLLFRVDLFLEIANDVLHRRFTEGVRRRFSLYGKTFVAKLAYRNLVCTIDPENLQAFMSTRFDDWTIIANRRKLIQVMLGDGVFSTEGDIWRHSRAIISRSMKGIDLSAEMFEKHVQRLVTQAKDEAGGPVNLGVLVNDYTMGTAGELVLGSEDSCETERFRSDFASVGQMARSLTIFIKSIPYLGQILFGKSFTETRLRVLRYVDNIIDKRTSSKERDTEPLVHGLSRIETDRVRVRSEALNILLAGRDTVGIGLSELFYLLARHPAVWARLREEVASVEIKSVSELQRMTYLSYVINEALRLRPALAVHARRAVNDTVLPRGGGPDGMDSIFVPRGTFVMYSNYSLHRNPEIFGDDVDCFRPERWAHISPERYEYLNWGAGPRLCPGKKMGLAMMAYLTARMAQEFVEIKPVGDEPWEEERAFSFTNRHGLRVTLN